MTKIFAHRGASGYAPENTLEAFALAMDIGAEWNRVGCTDDKRW